MNKKTTKIFLEVSYKYRMYYMLALQLCMKWRSAIYICIHIHIVNAYIVSIQSQILLPFLINDNKHNLFLQRSDFSPFRRMWKQKSWNKFDLFMMKAKEFAGTVWEPLPQWHAVAVHQVIVVVEYFFNFFVIFLLLLLTLIEESTFLLFWWFLPQLIVCCCYCCCCFCLFISNFLLAVDADAAVVGAAAVVVVGLLVVVFH